MTTSISCETCFLGQFACFSFFVDAFEEDEGPFQRASVKARPIIARALVSGQAMRDVSGSPDAEPRPSQGGYGLTCAEFYHCSDLCRRAWSTKAAGDELESLQTDCTFLRWDRCFRERCRRASLGDSRGGIGPECCHLAAPDELEMQRCSHLEPAEPRRRNLR